MALFQSSVLNKYLKQQDDTVVAKAYKKYTKYFHDATIQQNIKDSNEEQFQATFLNELFVKILWFTLNPQPKYNLTTEFKNVKNARKADGAILLNDEALAVIELKGTNTKDLESIRQQAFDYKANQPGCVYVVTSNFEKLRFYINNAVDFEEFDLFNLSYNRFELLYLCLYKDHLLKNLPLQIKEASIHEEEIITKKFYSDYSLFKREVFRDIVKRNLRNPELRDLGEASSKKALFKKTQKLLDRFLFIFFGEDRGLLPPNSIPKILDQWKQLEKMDAYTPLYDRYKKYFTYLNEGWKGEDHEIFAYNGGLFKPDPVLDSIEIDDALLFKHTSVLTKYDFESSVDVNILGHIFEHSLNEIESVNAEIDGVEFDKQKTKRKKDGVFYTPKYITKYIVDNTVGKLCEEKKAELEILEEEYLKGPKHRAKKTIIKLDEQIQAYRNWLLTLTICDPACGSGAFLNQALEFLILEHRWIDEMTSKLFGGGLVFQDVENSILENNIYGVDLNDESVEIAKLSLWLRTAQKGRKLTSLNNNIKCGNSLIDSKAVAGDKAFKWEDEFPDVFKNGGFDVVIGNPPYVRQELIKPFKEYFESKFHTYQSSADLYVYFIELSLDRLLSENGYYSIIVANKWMRAKYGSPLRKWLKLKTIKEIIDFGDLPVFADATAYPCILTVTGQDNPKSFFATKVDTLAFPSLDHYVKENSTEVLNEKLDDSAWSLSDQNVGNLLSKLKNSGKPLKEVIDNKMYVGLKTGYNAAFIIDENSFTKIITNGDKYHQIVKPYAVGRDLHRYGRTVVDKYLICIPSKWTNKQGSFSNENEAWNWLNRNYSEVANYLENHEEKCRKRTDKGEYWWELRACDYYSEFEKDKIIYSEIATEGRFTIDRDKIYCDMTAFIIGSKSRSLLGILNSKLFTFIFKHSSSEIRGGFLRWKRQYLNPLPIPENYESPILSDLVENIMERTKKYMNYRDNLVNYIRNTFEIQNISKKLQSWHTLDFSDFIKELNKAIKKVGGEKLSKMDEMEWMELFETKKKEALELKGEIDRTDREIDGVVYELYGLTDEEVQIVEGN